MAYPLAHLADYFAWRSCRHGEGRNAVGEPEGGSYNRAQLLRTQPFLHSASSIPGNLEVVHSRRRAFANHPRLLRELPPFFISEAPLPVRELHRRPPAEFDRRVDIRFN